ncbi:hypothetical protein BRC82_02480 [Halobacteriales archaeon QS_1_67_19]|nr:MAG: hypothetical protein BRC82_02480 [Halobacteriales archaeon QS_1_67_19]
MFDPEGDQPLTVDDEIIADAALVNVTETDSGDAVETERDEIIGPHFRSAVSTAPITALVDRG